MISSFKDYVDLDRIAEEILAQTWAPGSELTRAEFYRQIMMNLSLGYFVFFQSDPDHPEFIPFLNSVFLLQPNPDDTYYLSIVDGRGQYRLSGDRGSVHLLTVTLNNTMMGVDKVPGALLAELDVDGLPAAPDGSVDIIFGGDRAPDGHQGGWVPLDPSTRYLLVRQRSYDWGKEADARLAIQRLDADPLKPRLTVAQIDERLRGMRDFAGELSRLWIGHQARLAAKSRVNEFHFTPFTGGVQIQAYWETIFEVEDDEALILETDIPDRAPYWNVQLNDELFNTAEYVYRQSSLNGHQAKLDADGRFRAVVCSSDPGVPNWIDTFNHRTGSLIGRWYDCSSQPVPVIRRVKLNELRAHLPPETPHVSAEERKQALLARSKGAQMRRRW